MNFRPTEDYSAGDVEYDLEHRGDDCHTTDFIDVLELWGVGCEVTASDGEGVSGD